MNELRCAICDQLVILNGGCWKWSSCDCVGVWCRLCMEKRGKCMNQCEKDPDSKLELYNKPMLVLVNNNLSKEEKDEIVDCVEQWDKSRKRLKLEKPMILKGHTGAVTSVVLSSDGLYLYSGSWDKSIRKWSTASGQLVRKFKGHTDYVTTVAVSSDGLYLYSGSEDNSIRKWSTESGQPVREFKGHSNSVTRVALSSDGAYLYSGSVDKTIRRWKIDQ